MRYGKPVADRSLNEPCACNRVLGSVDIRCRSERKRRTGFVDFVKDAESQAFERDCLSNCSVNWQGRQSTKILLAYVVACRPAKQHDPVSREDGFRAPVRGRVFTGLTAKCPHNLAKSSRDHACAARKGPIGHAIERRLLALLEAGGLLFKMTSRPGVRAACHQEKWRKDWCVYAWVTYTYIQFWESAYDTALLQSKSNAFWRRIASPRRPSCTS